ncbi:MAG TPA: hypothetical protein PLB88_11020, partial [Thermoanaerobaculaceae bacterium]|nr:hypothetical protein [Thermoanaerobaculaceae bacterium]
VLRPRARSARLPLLGLLAIAGPGLGSGVADNDGGGITPERPPLPADVVTALKDASLEGSEALARCFKGLSEATRGRIVADYAEEWASLKADAAKVQS